MSKEAAPKGRSLFFAQSFYSFICLKKLAYFITKYSGHVITQYVIIDLEIGNLKKAEETLNSFAQLMDSCGGWKSYDESAHPHFSLGKNGKQDRIKYQNIMARQGDKIKNARTGQSMIFLKTGAETNGELLQIECFSPPTLEREPEHIHPFQENSFEIISGNCIFCLDGKEQIVGPGQSITIPAKMPHHFWNPGDTVAQYIQEFRPVLKIDRFFETFFALARDGKLNKKGIPNLFHVSVIGLAYKNEIRLTNPSWALQNIIYKILSPCGKLMGYKADYKSTMP